MSKKLQKSEEFSPIFNRIIDLSELRGITVSNLLDEFTTSRSTINAWKNGNINIAIIPDIAKRLGVSIEYLLTGADEPGIKYDFGNNNTAGGDVKVSNITNNAGRFDETSIQLLEAFQSLSLMDKAKVMSLVAELSQDK